MRVIIWMQVHIPAKGAFSKKELFHPYIFKGMVNPSYGVFLVLFVLNM